MANPPFIESARFQQSIEQTVEQIRTRLDVFGFAVWPFMPDPEHGIPAGFCTAGFTRVGMPEFYVSGVDPSSHKANDLIKRLRDLYDYARDTDLKTTALELCMQVNLQPMEPGESTLNQWRPIDPTRLMYGQGTALRYWAEASGIVDQVTAIQIVHRESAEEEYPMVSTPEQLLIEWAPYGAEAYVPQWEKIQDVPTI